MQGTRHLLISAMLAVAFAPPAFADTTATVTLTQTACSVAPPDDVADVASPSVAAGAAAMTNHNYAQARANFRPLAAKGDKVGMRDYGLLLMENCTGLQDKAQGVSWLTKASDAGDAAAQNRLAVAYLNGQGVAEDDAKAFDLYSKSATAGNAEAESQLGYLYLSGRGVAAPDPYQGMQWSVKAGEQGNPIALINIAQAYFRGGALPQDNASAAYYMFVAIERSTTAQRQRYANTSNSIIRGMSQADLARAADRAKRWSPGAGSLSDVLADAKRRHDKGA
jgi:TPR repeat protein